MMRIGIDLDNTIIDYRPSFETVAQSIGIPFSGPPNIFKAQLRESHNETWQFFQSRLYTDGLDHAVVSPGVKDFLRLAVDLGVELAIVSHKTEQTPLRFGSRPLREPAKTWLYDHGILPHFLAERTLWFCDTQDLKIEQISTLGLDWFIDDLIEVLTHKNFPKQTRPYWFKSRNEMNTRGRGLDAPGLPKQCDFQLLVGELKLSSPSLRRT